VPNWTVDRGFCAATCFRSSPARSSNRADGNDIKDGLYSLIDYLDPEATRAFLKTTHEKYQALFGDEFGTTVLASSATKRTTTASFPGPPSCSKSSRNRKATTSSLLLCGSWQLTDEAQRAKADYYDVWSDLFARNFFDVLADWNQKNNMEDLRHIGASSVPIAMIHNEGDFFRDMRHVNVPGIDNLNRIGPGREANWTEAGLLRGASVRKAESVGGVGRRPLRAGQVRNGLPFRAPALTALQIRGGYSDSAAPAGPRKRIRKLWRCRGM